MVFNLKGGSGKGRRGTRSRSSSSGRSTRSRSSSSGRSGRPRIYRIDNIQLRVGDNYKFADNKYKFTDFKNGLYHFKTVDNKNFKSLSEEQVLNQIIIW